MKTLRKGDLGAEVVELQRLMGITADGHFGPITEMAVKIAQKKFNIPVTGVADVVTWIVLGKPKPMNQRDRLRDRFGDPMNDPRPFETKWMMTWFCKKEFDELPFHKVYANRLLIPHLQRVFQDLHDKNQLREIKSYGGCWNPRYVRGYEKKKIESIHTWGLAVDFNVSDNPLGMSYDEAIAKGLTPFTPEFQQTWRDAGWICGIDFRRGDGMHFQKVNV